MARARDTVARQIGDKGRGSCSFGLVALILLLSCAFAKAPPKDQIGDEEYRVMSAVLKDHLRERYETAFRPWVFVVPEGASAREADSIRSAEGARADSLHRKYGFLSSRVYWDTSRTPEFYDTLVTRFGKMAYYVARDSVNAKVVFDSLSRKYGKLDYYLVLSDCTGDDTAGSHILETSELKEFITPELLKAYNENNRRAYKLRRERFGDSLVVELEPRGEVDSTFGPDEWREAYLRRYPLSDDTWSISRVGFNSDTTLALVSVGVQMRRGRVAARLTILRKSDEGWIVLAKESSLVW